MTRLSDATIRTLQAEGRLPEDVQAPKRAKYGAKRCTVHEPPHHSLKECRRYGELLLLEKAGSIRNLCQQVPIVLEEAVVLDGRRKPALRFVADFTYEEAVERPYLSNVVMAHHWRNVVEDVKSPATRRTSTYRLKKHLLKARHGIKIRET